jgi:geranylgeranyl transferase type-2 subunit alpha
MREYPKCYWIWLYRKWCLGVSPEADWDTELKLVTKMLEVDARNCIITIIAEVLTLVHGWGYRRYVVSNIENSRGISLAKTEFDYSTTKTNNISNFSAWHSRSNLIPHLLPPTSSPDFEHERKIFLETGLNVHHLSGLIRRAQKNAKWFVGRSG